MQRRLADVKRFAHAFLETVDRLTEVLALFRRHAPEPLHELRDAALLAERGDANILERTQIARRLNGVQQFPFQLLEVARRHRSSPWPVARPAMRQDLTAAAA